MLPMSLLFVLQAHTPLALFPIISRHIIVTRNCKLIIIVTVIISMTQVNSRPVSARKK
jgi:hypothetical protein